MWVIGVYTRIDLIHNIIITETVLIATRLHHSHRNLHISFYRVRLLLGKEIPFRGCNGASWQPFTFLATVLDIVRFTYLSLYSCLKQTTGRGELC